MEFLGYQVSTKKLATIRDRLRDAPARYIPGFHNLYHVTVAEKRQEALDEDAEAVEAERALDEARDAAQRRRVENESQRKHLIQTSRHERELADDAPSRRLARDHDLLAEQAELAIAALDEEDDAAEAKLAPFERRAWGARRQAHMARIRALEVLREAVDTDIWLEIEAARRAASRLEQNLGR